MREISREILEKFLGENIPQIEGKDIWVWGTGNTASLYQEGFERLEKEGVFIQGYCDNNSAKWGKSFNSKPVLSPDELKKKENICLFVCSTQIKVIKEIGKQLDGFGLEWYFVDEVILKLHKKEVLECYDFLEDEDTKRVYADIILSRICGEDINESDLSNQYFARKQFTELKPQEVYVDCGAFVGDTLEKYIWKKSGVFGKIIAFEPDENNFAAMEKRVKRLKEEWNIKEDKVCLFPYGVGERTQSCVFESYANNNGLGSKVVASIEDGQEGCKIVSLDECLQERYSLLKADIESYEYKMLLGAKEGIKKWKPLLAICIYHNAVDLYSIPLLVKSIVPEYKMAICHHSNDWAETVLYAWVE